MTVYAALRNRLLVIDGEDDVPTANERLVGHDLECVAVHPDRPKTVFCGTFDAGLQRSIDGGDSWEQVGIGSIDPNEDPALAERRGVEEVSVMSVAIDPSNPEDVWAGTEPSDLFKSTDRGDSWAQVGVLTDLSSASEWSFPPRPYTHHVRWIEVDPTDPERVYVGIEAGALLVTPDAGETWIERPPGSRRDNHTLSTHPDAEGRVYSAAGDGYAESADGGETWEHPQAGLEHRYVWSVAADAGDPDTVVASAAHGAGDAHGHGGAENADSYLYRKEGNGPEDAAWERVNDGFPSGEGVLRAVLAPGVAAGELYAVNNHGVYRSRDGGRYWDILPVSWESSYQTETARGLVVVP